ncbi:MAG TPA: Sua5/YciO/YrdC/YwlC family protein, partial [Pyrinomonadaceae bacterium]|nr:Sua5/YciO/YrdC/YwlC family protein [Pyrinomonadaceae bacterium]
MRTVLTADPLEAAEFISSGGTVAFPTETVYGLGADAFDEAAIGKIFKAKQRPADNPLIAHISDLSQIGLLADGVPGFAANLIDSFFPG